MPDGFDGARSGACGAVLGTRRGQLISCVAARVAARGSRHLACVRFGIRRRAPQPVRRAPRNRHARNDCVIVL